MVKLETGVGCTSYDISERRNEIFKIKTSKEAIVGRAQLWIPNSFLFQLNKTIIFSYIRKFVEN